MLKEIWLFFVHPKETQESLTALKNKRFQLRAKKIQKFDQNIKWSWTSGMMKICVRKGWILKIKMASELTLHELVGLPQERPWGEEGNPPML